MFFKTIKKTNDRLKENRQSIKMMNVEIDSLLSYTSDVSLKKEIKKLSETVRYSDPMSTIHVEVIENDIAQFLGKLKEAVYQNDMDDAISCCITLQSLFEQRNALLKATK